MSGDPMSTNPSTPHSSSGPASHAPGEASPLRIGGLSPWRVLLHNDDFNETRHVVRTLMSLVHMNFSDATDVMIRAHTRGIALVTTTHRERAELFKEQFARRGLNASIEPAIP